MSRICRIQTYKVNVKDKDPKILLLKKIFFFEKLKKSFRTYVKNWAGISKVTFKVKKTKNTKINKKMYLSLNFGNRFKKSFFVLRTIS